MIPLKLNEVLKIIKLNSNVEFIEQRKSQIEYQLELVNQWQLKTGGKYLLIGPNQSDLTLIIALAIGDKGLIESFEVTPGCGSAPVTFGVSDTKLLNLNCRIHFHSAKIFPFAEFNFYSNYFDGVIIAHATWYFAKYDELAKILQQISKTIPIIYFVEWDLNFTNFHQWGAYLAYLWQGEIAQMANSNITNIRSIISSTEVINLLIKNHYNIKQKKIIDTSKLLDGSWQLMYVLINGKKILKQLSSDLVTDNFLKQELSVIKKFDFEKIQSLPSYSLIAQKD